jgi:hypothetical protein
MPKTKVRSHSLNELSAVKRTAKGTIKGYALKGRASLKVRISQSLVSGAPGGPGDSLRHYARIFTFQSIQMTPGTAASLAEVGLWVPRTCLGLERKLGGWLEMHRLSAGVAWALSKAPAWASGDVTLKDQ